MRPNYWAKITKAIDDDCHIILKLELKPLDDVTGESLVLKLPADTLSIFYTIELLVKGPEGMTYAPAVELGKVVQ